MNTVTVRGRTDRAQMTIPAHWSAEDVRDEVELLAVLRAGEGVFAPTLVVTANPYEGSMAQYTATAVGNIVGTLTQARIIDVSAWNRAGEVPDHLAAQGRAVTYTHVSPATGEVLRTTDWLFIERGLAVQATGTTAAPDWMALAPELEAIASSLVASPGSGPRQPVDLTLPEGAQDDLASGELGQPVESIGGVIRHQPYGYDGEWIHPAAFALLDEMAEGLRLGRLHAAGHRPGLRELARTGLAEGTRLTDTGEHLRLHLAEPTASLRVEASGSGGRTRYQAWVHGPTVLVALGAGYHVHTGLQAFEGPSPEHVNVRVLPLTGLVRDMAAWLGLGPAWPLPALPARLPREQLAQRWAGNTQPPPGANPVLGELWAQDWFTWSLEARGTGHGPEPYSYLHGGPLGQFRLAAEGEATWIVPTHTVYAYDQLDDVVAAAVFDRPVRLQ